MPQQAKIGCHAITMTNCKAIDIQLLFGGRNTVKDSIWQMEVPQLQ